MSYVNGHDAGLPLSRSGNVELGQAEAEYFQTPNGTTPKRKLSSYCFPS